MEPTASTVHEYLESLPDERKQAISKLRTLIKKHLPKGYEEGIQYGMISYHVPLSVYDKTYNGLPLGYIAVASQKNYISLYLMSVYGDNEKTFRTDYQQSGKKLNMGKSCVRFKHYEDLPEAVIAAAVAAYTPAAFVKKYEAARA